MLLPDDRNSSGVVKIHRVLSKIKNRAAVVQDKVEEDFVLGSHEPGMTMEYVASQLETVQLCGPQIR